MVEFTLKPYNGNAFTFELLENWERQTDEAKKGLAACARYGVAWAYAVPDCMFEPGKGFVSGRSFGRVSDKKIIYEGRDSTLEAVLDWCADVQSEESALVQCIPRRVWYATGCLILLSILFMMSIILLELIGLSNFLDLIADAFHALLDGLTTLFHMIFPSFG